MLYEQLDGGDSFGADEKRRLGENFAERDLGAEAMFGDSERDDDDRRQREDGVEGDRRGTLSSFHS